MKKSVKNFLTIKNQGRQTISNVFNECFLILLTNVRGRNRESSPQKSLKNNQQWSKKATSYMYNFYSLAET